MTEIHLPSHDRQPYSSALRADWVRPRREEPSSGNHFTAADIAKLEGVTAAAIRERCRTGTMTAAHKTVGGVRIFHAPGVQTCSWRKHDQA